MDPVAVVGGGISGVACARMLTGGGVDVTLIDRGRRLGGRMAVRTVNGRSVDTGASDFTVSDDRFAAVVADWQARGLAREWTDTFDVFDDGQRGDPKQEMMRWASPGGLRSLVEDLAQGRGAQQSAVTRDEHTGVLVVDGRPASTVVLAMPDPQARRLLDPSFDSRARLVDNYAPTMAMLAGWERRSWRRRFEGAFVNGDPHLTWVADEGAAAATVPRCWSPTRPRRSRSNSSPWTTSRRRQAGGQTRRTPSVLPAATRGREVQAIERAQQGLPDSLSRTPLMIRGEA